TDGLPSSVPGRSFGGASAGSASPFAFAQSRALAPAARQTAITAPRVDALQTIERTVPLHATTGPEGFLSAPGGLEQPPFPLSPFSGPVDLTAALSALRVATQPDVAALSSGGGIPSGVSRTEAGQAIPDEAATPPLSPARPPAIPTAAALHNVNPIPSAENVDPFQDAARMGSLDAQWPSPELSPFSSPIDLTGSPVSPTGAEPIAAGAFVPDVATIERLANAFFHGLTGGAAAAPPAVPASPPAPWSAPAQPGVPATASVVPVQPPFGVPDIPTDGLPSSVPGRSFGGASAGSASPFAFPQSRAL